MQYIKVDGEINGFRYVAVLMGLRSTDPDDYRIVHGTYINAEALTGENFAWASDGSLFTSLALEGPDSR